MENIYDFAKPERVIPLKFHRINTSLVDDNNHKQILPLNRNFKKLLNLNKSLILQKLSVAYYCLVKNFIKSKQWGDIFKYLKIALHCYCKFGIFRLAEKTLRSVVCAMIDWLVLSVYNEVSTYCTAKCKK